MLLLESASFGRYQNQAIQRDPAIAQTMCTNDTNEMLVTMTNPARRIFVQPLYFVRWSDFYRCLSSAGITGSSTIAQPCTIIVMAPGSQASIRRFERFYAFEQWEFIFAQYFITRKALGTFKVK